MYKQPRNRRHTVSFVIFYLYHCTKITASVLLGRASVTLGFVGEMRSEARRKLRSVVEATGVNAPSHVVPSEDIFAKRVKRWEENYLSRQKPSTQKTMHYHVRKYLLPKWEKYPVGCITAEKVNERIGDPQLRHLSPTSLKHLVTTVCLILGRWFGRKKITYNRSTGRVFWSQFPFWSAATLLRLTH